MQRATALIALVLLLESSHANGVFEPLKVGQPVPAYSVRTLAGPTAHLRAGEPPTLVNIWATWCAPCRREFPALQQIHARYQQRGLRVLAVSIDAGADPVVNGFVTRSGATFAIGHDERGSISQLFKTVGLPETFLIGRDGTLLWHQVGAIRADHPGMQAAIDGALTAIAVPHKR